MVKSISDLTNSLARTGISGVNHAAVRSNFVVEGAWTDIVGAVGETSISMMLTEGTFDDHIATKKKVQLLSASYEIDFLGGKTEGLAARFYVLMRPAKDMRNWFTNKEDKEVWEWQDSDQLNKHTKESKNTWWRDYKKLPATYAWKFGKDEHEDCEDDSVFDLPALSATWAVYILPRDIPKGSVLFKIRAKWLFCHREERSITVEQSA